MKRFIAALLWVVTAACGSDSGGGGSLGSVGGNSLTVDEAIFAVDQDLLILLAGDRTGICDIYGGSSTPSGRYVVLATTFINTNDGRTPRRWWPGTTRSWPDPARSAQLASTTSRASTWPTDAP